jgi:RNA recognition motif-containing protein
MSRRLYVGNLPYKTTDEELGALFGEAGAVESVRVMRDMATGRARGFAFIDMASEEDAQKAITQFHGFAYEGAAARTSVPASLAGRTSLIAAGRARPRVRRRSARPPRIHRRLPPNGLP